MSAAIERRRRRRQMKLEDSLGAHRKTQGFSEMSHVIYTVVEHDGGWAYKVGDVFSETFATRELAHAAAATAALEQRTPGESRAIEYEDRSGRWHEEEARGDDRPDTDVED
jgi:hypothetical protein